MDHNYNLRSCKKLEPEVRSPSPSATVDAGDNGDVMESGPQHRALRNEYILKELFSHLSVDDLKECRLVNQVWNQVATRVLAPKAPILEFTDKDGIPRVELMEKFMNTVRNTESPPNRKFKINGRLVYNASPEKQLVLPRFIERVAPTVTHLSVRSDWRRLFPWKKPKKSTCYPKLKSVELRNTTVKSNEDFMITLLQHSPNLDNVTLLEVSRIYGDRLIKNFHWSKIRHLKLAGELEDGHFQKIVELGAAMKLQSFEMEAREFRSGTAFPKFLDGQSSSLETLKLKLELRNQQPHPKIDFRLPRIPKLKTLEVKFVDVYKGSAEEMYKILSLPSYSEWFPALNSVTFSGTWWYDLCRFLRSEDSAPVETVKTLGFDNMPFDAHDVDYFHMGRTEMHQVIQQLSQMFPRVRKLHAPADVDILKAIEMTHAWPELKHLKLFCGNSRNVDNALIGHDSDSAEYQRVSFLKPESQEFQQKERKIESNIFQFLQNLETLEMELDVNGCTFGIFERQRRATYFTDLSCRLVLLKLRNLRCLNLCGLSYQGDTCYQVTKPMLLEMSAKFKVIYKERKINNSE